MSQNTILIAVGNAGCKILSKAKTDLTKLYLDTDPEDIKKYSGIRIGEKVCGKYSALGDAELAQKAVEESKAEILDRLHNFNRVIIVTSLGGGSSNGGTKKLAEMCSELKKDVRVVCGLPFEVEGHRLAKAQQVLSQLEGICEVKTVQYEYPDRTISWGECQTIKDAEVLETLDTVIN